MSTVSTRKAQPQRLKQSDPFFYGWRYVNVVRKDGTKDLEQVPLTLEDVLHPQEGDHIVNSTEHADDVRYLSEVSGECLKDHPRSAVLFDCGVDLGLPRIRTVCPDIAVFFNVPPRRGRRGWSLFRLKEEGAKCALVIEVTSDSTRENDFGRKFKFYYRAGVAVYVIVNEWIENKIRRRLELIGYRHTPRGFERIPLSDDGRIWLEALGTWLGVSQDPTTGDERVVCFDAKTNEEIGDYQALGEARRLAEAKAAKAQREAAKARRVAAKAQREAAQAQNEAKDEARARVAAEARVRELEALLKRSKRDA